MREGDVIAGRFELQRLAGSGGMGDVYRARDRLGGVVALKVLRDAGRAPGADPLERAHADERFAREAQALAELQHPGIVRYVAHGRTAAGEPYLAMEWLEGETLAERLHRQGLTLAETQALGVRVAETLAAIHRRGFVHRDVKPSNLFLAGGEVERATLIDFGVARLSARWQPMTQTGAMIGTPGYLAPEQARGERKVDARADVFSLGCVLFKCVAGRGPFAGDDALSVLLKILLEDPPRLSSLRPGIPAALDDLVARMLAKSPRDRPPDAGAVAAELAALGDPGPDGAAPSSAAPVELTAVERRVMCLILARDPVAATRDEAPTIDEGAGVSPVIREVVARHQGQLEALADRSFFVKLASAGAATDLAAQAARCALALRPLLGEAGVVVVSGRGVVSSRLPVGELVDRAVRLLPRPGAIRVDDVTAGLLGARFDVAYDDAGPRLLREREGVDEERVFLGKRTECVGRNRELSLLEGMFAQCVDDGAAAALVIAPPGMGKSRLRVELTRRLRARCEPAEIWLARGDPTSAGSPFGLLGRALRDAAGIRDGEPLEVRRRKLAARVARHVDADQGRITEFLGELAGAPFPAEASVQLAAARRDSALMGDQLRRAWEDLMRAECAAQPVMLVFEDLHWGDLPSVKLVDAALRALDGAPLLVLALARPGVHDLFPGLWADRRLHEIHLGALTHRASEAMVRQALPDADAATVARIVERAGGHAFYLEELIRAVTEGRGADLPETVLAMVQARLDRLDPEERRLLRAASVFGHAFWPSGLTALLGGEHEAARVGERLASLQAGEAIDRRREARFQGEEEYAFRHALVREAAYATLTDDDRALGHRLAGRWLERAGETDVLALAEHFERGGLPAQAARWYRRAAEDALEGNDFDAARARAERGLACLTAEAGPPTSRASAPNTSVSGADAAGPGAFHLLLAEAHRWRGRFAEAEHASLEAMHALPEGSSRWYRAASEAILASGRLGHGDRILTVTERLLAQPLEAERADARVVALARASSVALEAGRYDLSEILLAAIDAVTAELPIEDPATHARTLDAQARRASYVGDLGAFLRLSAEALACFERAGHLRLACTQRVMVGYVQVQLGAYAEAEATLREALTAAERMGLIGVVPSAQENLGMALAGQGRWDEARAFAAESIAASRAQGHRRMEAGARIYLALMLLMSGDSARAEEEVRAALELGPAPPLRAHALATLAEVLLAAGRAAEALVAARDAIDLLGSLGSLEEGDALVRLVYAEALLATDDARAGSAILGARDALLTRAAKIGDPAQRASFLERVPENARTLELAHRWAERGDLRS